MTDSEAVLNPGAVDAVKVSPCPTHSPGRAPMAWWLAGIRGTAGTLDQVGMHQRYCCTVLSAQSARLDALPEGRSKGATLQAEHKAKISARERLVNPNMRSENKTSKVCLSARSYLIFGSKLQELAK